jgi:hypothetical protein
VHGLYMNRKIFLTVTSIKNIVSNFLSNLPRAPWHVLRLGENE